MSKVKGTLVISNMDIGDETFECEHGSWNVTRAQRDCDAGKHELYSHPVRELFEMNHEVEVDEAKVKEFVAILRADPDAFSPLILAMENGMAWLIEGHHRLHALHRLGISDCHGFVIEEAASKPYRIHYNGKRTTPWR